MSHLVRPVQSPPRRAARLCGRIRGRGATGLIYRVCGDCGAGLRGRRGRRRPVSEVDSLRQPDEGPLWPIKARHSSGDAETLRLCLWADIRAYKTIERPRREGTRVKGASWSVKRVGFASIADAFKDDLCTLLHHPRVKGWLSAPGRAAAGGMAGWVGTDILGRRFSSFSFGARFFLARFSLFCHFLSGRMHARCLIM